MSWGIFKQNVLRVMNNPAAINNIDLVAKTFAIEYDAAIRRGGDTINRVAIKTGNIQAMEQLFKSALQRGVSSSQPYDLVGEMGQGVLSYWTGATLNEFPLPIIPAVGSVQNVGVVSNIVTNTGIWAPTITIPSIPIAETEIPVEFLLETIPDDNNTVEGSLDAVLETGVEFLTDGNDDGGEQLNFIKQSLPIDNPPFDESSEEVLELGESNEVDASPILCGSGFDYNARVSPNFKLRNLTLDCTFPHKLKSQRGFSVGDLVCNLQNVATNLLEPIKTQFPQMVINSAFRGTPSIAGSVSQHEKGEAVDLQFKGLSPKDYLEVTDWVLKNVAFDQFIFEHGNSIWLHISCKRGGVQRKQVLTMYKGKYTSGIKLHYK